MLYYFAKLFTLFYIYFYTFILITGFTFNKEDFNSKYGKHIG
jgi:hypothetical protein